MYLSMTGSRRGQDMMLGDGYTPASPPLHPFLEGPLHQYIGEGRNFKGSVCVI